MKTLVRIMLISLFALPLTNIWAAPTGYSVNSDESPGDRLHSIDLATGQSTMIGLVQSLQGIKIDVEGMAFDKFGVLWAVDEESRQLFPVNTNNGDVMTDSEVFLNGLTANSGNDFGMTFTCEGNLYVSSVASDTFYALALDGQLTPIGNLGANISALAAYGNPSRIYGLGNGLLPGGIDQDNRSLYEIDLATGQAMLIGNIGNGVSDYFEAGLSFDEDGNLWAITDRASSGSEVLQLDIDTGQATVISSTTVTGFESLAVAPPAGCDAEPPVEPPVIPRDPNPTGYVGIPTINSAGSWIAILALLFTGLAVIRQRF